MLLIAIENTNIATLINDSILMPSKANEVIEHGKSDEVDKIAMSAVTSLVYEHLDGFTTLAEFSEKLAAGERYQLMINSLEAIVEWRASNSKQLLNIGRTLKDATGRELHINIRISHVQVYNTHC